MDTTTYRALASSEADPKTVGRHAGVVRVAWPLGGMALSMASGFACLGYEIIWTQQLGVALGHEYVAVLAVLAAFFGGLAVGAACLARAIERSARPGLFYAACEAVIALWALLLSWLMPAASGWFAMRIGAEPGAVWHWSVAFAGPFVLLLPATCAMGATLPAIEKASAGGRKDGAAIGALYAANTLGAVLGVVACAFVLVPELGLAWTARVCAAVNGVCALWAFALLRAPADPPTLNAIMQDRPLFHARGLGVLVGTGGLGIGYEVVVVRVLAQMMENTVYTFAVLLAVYLAGTAAGAAIQQRWLAGRGERDALLAAVAGACSLGAFVIGSARAWPGAVAEGLAGSLGDATAALAGEAAVAVAAFLPASVAMGALFSRLCVEARREGLHLGSALAVNTLGAALAPLLFGVLLLPAIGARAALLSIAAGYLLLTAPSAWRRAVRDTRAAAALACAALLAWLTPALAVVDVPEGGRLVRYEDGVAASVSVVQDAGGVATLHIDNRAQEGSTATLLADARQAWLPLLLHAQPRRALFLGLGSGLSAESAGWDPELEVDAVELLPEVVAASPLFTPVLGKARAPHVVAADARRYVRARGAAYDVIVADLFHPARSGAAALYTVEHFAAVRARLTTAGLFCQWLPLHQLDLGTMRSIVASFMRVYPDAKALLATNSLDTPVVGLVARRDGDGFDATQVRARLARMQTRDALVALHFEDEFAVLGSFIAGPAELHRFATGAELNTDDHPVVAHRAAWATYAHRESPRARLLGLLRALSVEPGEVLATAGSVDDALRARLTAYFAARDRFIELGTGVRPNPDVRAMLAQVRAPLLAILRASPDFRPAYDPLLNMAGVLAASSSADARPLLEALAAAQPARTEAEQLLQQLSRRERAPSP